MSHQSFNWFFTAKGHDDLVYDESKVKFIRYARETGKGENAYKHLQGFIGMKKKTRLAGVKSIFAPPHNQTIHLQVQKGRFDQCEVYCTKENTFCHSFGQYPKTHKQSAMTKWDRARSLIDAGKVEDIRQESFELWTRYHHKFYEDYNRQNPPTRHQAPLEHRNIWLYGKSGSGKTSLVYDTFAEKDIYLKNLNKWWDHYTGQPVVFIDEVHPKWVGIDALKKWADRYPFNPEVKNGHLGNIRPHHIIVCTQYTIDQCTEDDKELRDALHRRFDVCHVDEIRHPFRNFNPFRVTVQDVLCPPTCKKRKINKLLN